MLDKRIDRKKRIFIACGGSAGHIFPGLTLAEELVKRYGDNVEIYFLTSDNKLGRSLLEESEFDFYTLPLLGSNIGSARECLSFISSLLRGSIKSMKIIFSNRPDCFVGFGAYVAGPPFVISSMLGVPTLIHEQNAMMGKANRIMRNFATKVALSFPKETGPKKENIVVTGNPVRESVAKIQDKESAIDFLGMKHDRFTILVIGGSQGSQIINSLMVEMFKNMDRQLLDRIQVIHISGDRDYERMKNVYRKINIIYRLHPFFKDMGILYSATDISISRAGSSVLFELCAHRIPSILIPYPLAGGHQLHNARFLSSNGAALMIEESELSEASLLSTILRLMEEKNLRESMSEKMGMLANPDATKRLADEVGSLAGLD